MKEIVKGGYIHKLEYAPTDDILKSYRAKKISWENYEKEYIKLLNDRNILNNFDVKSYDENCFLCSENKPDYCHRRLFVEYLKKNLKEEINIVHLFK